MIPPRAQLTTYTPFLQRGNVLSPRSPGFILKKKEHVSDNLEHRGNKNQHASYTNQFKFQFLQRIATCTRTYCDKHRPIVVMLYYQSNLN